MQAATVRHRVPRDGNNSTSYWRGCIGTHSTACISLMYVAQSDCRATSGDRLWSSNCSKRTAYTFVVNWREVVRLCPGSLSPCTCCHGPHAQEAPLWIFVSRYSTFSPCTFLVCGIFTDSHACRSCSLPNRRRRVSCACSTFPARRAIQTIVVAACLLSAVRSHVRVKARNVLSKRAVPTSVSSPYLKPSADSTGNTSASANAPMCGRGKQLLKFVKVALALSDPAAPVTVQAAQARAMVTSLATTMVEGEDGDGDGAGAEARTMASRNPQSPTH